ncbi:MAG TPA: formylglycine-generating enzyme family protein [Anaerolineales bacterium]
MKSLRWILLTGVLVASCSPTAGQTPTLPLPTETALPTEVVPTAVPPLAPAGLAGPQSGSSMPWLDGATLVFVPSGEFKMGTGAGNSPEKAVYLDAYWIYSTPVTNKMYSQCVVTGNCAPPAQEVESPVYSNPDYGDFPVVGVTWDMASNYCGWAQAALPTEAQWEKAARGDAGAVFPWGLDSPNCSLLNFKGCVGHSTRALEYPDGRSPYGAYDMAGNVFQWVNDFYDEGYYNVMDSRNPMGPASGNSRSLRGSSYETEASLIASGLRHFGASAYHSAELSFRCAVTQPKAIAPFCQLTSYVPTGAGPTGNTCELPQAGVPRNYCSGRAGYATITIPEGASYRITTSGFTCSDDMVNGERLLTCSGPDDSTGKVTVCNSACGGAPSETGSPVVCNPGYRLDASGATCTYTPIEREPGVAGCPVGYNLIQRGDRKICAVGLNQNGECPAGTYFDGQYGACVSPVSGADAPYGINDSASASQYFQGCAAGYSYDQNYQCCQANTGGAYPGCPLGFGFDSTANACVPQSISVSAPGCVTVSLNIARCSIVTDECGAIGDEAICKRNPACLWIERTGICRSK